MPILFTDKENLPRQTLTQADLPALNARNEDAQAAEYANMALIAERPTYFGPLFGRVLARLVTDDVITYETSDGKFVIYDGEDINHHGVIDADALSQRNLTEPIPYDGVVVLGGGGNDVIAGTGFDDRLIGGSGNDNLHGLEGANHLEGGADADAYHVVSDGKADTIRDADGRGVIELDGEILRGGEALRFEGGLIGNNWTSEDGAITYQRDGTTLNIIKAGKVEIRILNYDYANNALSLNLELIDDLDYTRMHSIGATTYDQVLLSNDVRSVSTGGMMDSVTGSARNDYILLGANNDHAQGGLGNDIIFGQEGNDHIQAGPNTATAEDARLDQDYAVGGEGRDIVLGGAGNDTLHGGDIDDHLLLEAVAGTGDWVDGGEGMDSIYGGAAGDFLQGGADMDLLYGGAGDDVILGDGEIRQTIRMGSIAGSAQTVFWQENYTHTMLLGTAYVSVPYAQPANFAWTVSYTNGARDDFELNLGAGQSLGSETRVSEDGGSDIIYGGAGNDWIAGQKGSDHIEGGDGDDVLYGDEANALPGGWEGNDTLIAGHGADRLFGGGGDDRLWAMEDDGEADVLHGGEGNDDLRGGTGGDKLYGEAGNDLLIAGMDGSELDGGEGADTLYASAGNDVLKGGEGDDRFYGNRGADEYHGGEGSDTFYFSSVLLFETTDVSTVKDASAEDRIVLDGARLDEVTFVAEREGRWRSEDGHVLLMKEGETLNIQTSGGVGRIVAERFVNGALGLFLPGLDGNHAPEVAGRVAAQTGREDEPFTLVLSAALFTDPDGDALTYSVTRSDGSSLPSWLAFDPETRTLSGTPENGDAGNLELKVTATDPAGLSASQVFALAIEGVPANGVVGTEANDSLYGTAGDDRIEGLSGDDGLFGGGGNDHLLGGEGDDRLFSGTGDNRLEGGAGNDLLYSEGGGNLLLGGAGGDRFFGGAGDDILDGGEGSDRLFGGAGDDVYVLRPGDGNDVLVAYDPDADAIDALRLEGVASTALRLLREGDHLVVAYGENDTLTLENHYRGADYQIDRVECADVTLSAAELLARVPVWLTEGGDHFHFTKGGDIVAGLGGDDSLYGDDGDDVLSGEDGNDGLFGGAGNDHLLGGEGGDRLFGGEGDDRLEGGTGNDTLYGESGNDCLSGGAGDDLIYGGTEDDRLHGGTGDDHLYGGTGGDTYVFIRGDGEDVMRDYDTEGGSADTLEFGEIGAGELWFARNGNHLEVRVLGGNDKVTIENWYLDALYRIETFRTEEAVLRESEVQALVEAMSGYAEPQEAHLPEGYEDLIQIIGSTWESV